MTDPRVIPSSFIYQHPSIASLASYISGLAEGSNTTNGGDTRSAKIDAMYAMVHKYTADFRQHVGSGQSNGESVLVTGTTGWLGSLILADLLKSDVRRVYAINRKGAPLLERQTGAFKERGLDFSLLLSEKLVLLEADLTVEYLGLDNKTLEEV